MEPRNYLVWVVVLAILTVRPVECFGNQTAEQFFQNRDWENAVSAYQSISEEESASAEIWYRLGRSYLELGQHQNALAALTTAVELLGDEATVQVRLSLARVFAALGNSKAMLAQLQLIVGSGATPYMAVKNASEFSAYQEQAEFMNTLKALHPCSSDQYREFDFWLGRWTVEAPNRPGWQAKSHITLGNDGCSIHESYQTPGGYAGNSINFYDRSKKQWHQTWTDNQGVPLFLDGGINDDGHMVLSNDSSRITWSVTEDGRVRQLWEATSDEGKSWTVAFDGYYSRKED